MTHNINQRFRIRAMLAAVLLAAAATILAMTFETRPAEAAFPGQNGKIVYESLDLSTWNYEIYVMNPDGTGPTPLTDTPAADRMPALSPDGERLVFQRTIIIENNPEIYVVDADGSDPTRLTEESPSFDSAPAFSPDGTRMAFSSNREEDDEIYT